FPAAARPVPDEPEHPEQLAWNGLSAADQERATRAFVDVGKALAAFERRIVSRASPFDRFVAGLRGGDASALRALDERAQRGAKLFVGRARCVLCHDGPNFTDLEFHDNRSPASEEGGDPGRRLGIRRLKQDPFNTLGAYADDGGATGRAKLERLLPDAHG